MQTDKAPKKVSLAEIISTSGLTDTSWNRYSRLHDSFLDELSYGKRGFCHTDAWQLHDTGSR